MFQNHTARRGKDCLCTVVVLVCGAMSGQMCEERRISRLEGQDTIRQDKQRPQDNGARNRSRASRGLRFHHAIPLDSAVDLPCYSCGPS